MPGDSYLVHVGDCVAPAPIPLLSLVLLARLAAFPSPCTPAFTPPALLPGLLSDSALCICRDQRATDMMGSFPQDFLGWVPRSPEDVTWEASIQPLLCEWGHYSTCLGVAGLGGGWEDVVRNECEVPSPALAREWPSVNVTTTASSKPAVPRLVYACDGVPASLSRSRVS